jgi:hypothetical protein
VAAPTAKKRLPKTFILGKFKVDKNDAIRETSELQQWLASRKTFQETAHAIPELEQRRSFCAAIGVTFGEKIYDPNRLSFELSLGGNYFPDLVIGDAENKDLVLVEFEGAETSQIFLAKKDDEQYPDFSPKFRQGFFQLLDWVHRLKDASDQNKLDWFTFIPETVRTLLVVGRDHELGDHKDSQGQRRLESLAQSFMPGNNKLFIVTYDQLIAQVAARLSAF